MFVKPLNMDTSCLHTVGSTKLPPVIGVKSVKRLRVQKFVENPNWVEQKSSRVYRRLKNGGSGVRPNLGCCPNSIKSPNQVEQKEVWVPKRGKSKSNGGGVKVSLKHGNFPEGKGDTKSLSKWLCYGGCLPLILEALEREKDIDEALKPWVNTLNNKERSIILKEQVSWERALEIFEWFKRKGCYELNVIHYNIVLRILGKARKWEHLESIWNEMENKGVVPTNSTYGTLIDVYTKGGLTGESLIWLEKMKKQGMEPDEVTMGVVVQTYKKAGEFDKAEQFFKKWSSGEFVNGNGGGRETSTMTKNVTLEPHVCLSSYTYNTLIDTYGKAGQLKEASDTFARMLKEGIVPNTVTFNTMIHICGNHGQLEEVTSLTNKMEELQCSPDTRTYNILISLHTKYDDINAAMSYFSKMKKAGLKPDHVSYRTLLYAFSIRHMVWEAEALVLEMDEMDLEIDEFIQSALTRMYIEAGMLQKSWSWFERYHLKGNMSSKCYSAIIDAYGERGYILEAEKAFLCCQQSKKLSVLEFNVMIKAYGIGRKYTMACQLFDGMEKHGVFPDRCSYGSLIQILSGLDLPHVAKNYVRKMQEAGLVSDCIPYCAVMSSFVKLGQLEMTEEFFKEMVRCDVQPDIVAYGILINAFADVGSVNAAVSYVNDMRNAGFPGNAVIFNSLIKLYTKVGHVEEAKEIYQLLQSSDVGPDVYSSNCMIDLYSEHGMVREAEEIFQDLKQRGDANEFSYAMMLCMYRRLGKFEKAIAIARKMREVGLLTDILSFNNVIGLYASDGRLKEAVETFWEMTKSGTQPDDLTFRSLGAVLVRCGASKEAIGKLEVARRNDVRSGMQAWMRTLCSMICVEDAALDACIGHAVSLNSTLSFDI